MTTIESYVDTATASIPNGEILRRRKLEVAVTLTNDETRLYGQQLARRKLERDAIEEKRKSVNAQYKGQLAEKDSEINRLTAAIDTGKELRNMDVYDELVGSQVYTRRADTHEVVDQKPATIADAQGEMFPGELEDFEAFNAVDGGEGGPEPVGEMAVSSVGDAVFVGGDGEEVEEEPKPAKKGRGKGKAKK